MAAPLICGFSAILVDGTKCCGLRHGTPHMARRCADRGYYRGRKAAMSHVAARLAGGEYVPVEFRGHAAWIEIDGEFHPVNSAARLQLRPAMKRTCKGPAQIHDVSEWLGGAK